MRTQHRLTAAAIFCRSFAWFPLCMLLLSLRSSEEELRILSTLLPDTSLVLTVRDQVLLPSAAVCGISFVTQLLARMIGQRFRTSPRLAFVLKLSAALLTSALCVFAVIRLSGSAFSAAVLTAAAVLVPLYKIDSSPEKLFRQEHFAAFFTAVILSVLLLYLSQMPIYTGWIFAVTAAVSAVHLLLCNRFMLLRLVNRRSNTETQVPQDIRRGNLILVAGVILLLAAVFLFHRQLTALFILMRDTAAKLFYKLMVLLSAAVEKISGYAGDEEMAEMAEESLPPAGQSSPFWILLWIPVFWVAWIIWSNLLSDWVFAFRSAFERLLAFLRGGRVRAGRFTPTADSDEYYDTETTERKPRSAKEQRRQWRRQLRAWKTQPDTREKFYAGYQLLLEAPVWEHGELCDADTVREIREKWVQHHTPQAALDAVTEAFHTDRYAERGLPERAVAELSAALDKLR